MCDEQLKFYKDIIANCLLWNKPEPRYHFFIGNGKIHGTLEGINCIKSDEFLDPSFKKDCLEVISVDKTKYSAFSKLVWAKKDNLEYFSKLGCIKIMRIMKEMGNEIYKNGLFDSAFQIYSGGVCALGTYDDESHGGCDQNEEHNKLLAQLYNNMAVIYYSENDYVKSRKYSKLALKWNPNYEKCKQRLKCIRFK